jgi:plasmid stabilization system protein ParE
MVEYQVVWTKNSQQQLRNIFKYISKDSVQNAKQVVEDIILSLE